MFKIKSLESQIMNVIYGFYVRSLVLIQFLPGLFFCLKMKGRKFGNLKNNYFEK